MTQKACEQIDHKMCQQNVGHVYAMFGEHIGDLVVISKIWFLNPYSILAGILLDYSWISYESLIAFSVSILGKPLIYSRGLFIHLVPEHLICIILDSFSLFPVSEQTPENSSRNLVQHSQYSYWETLRNIPSAWSDICPSKSHLNISSKFPANF